VQWGYTDDCSSPNQFLIYVTDIKQINFDMVNHKIFVLFFYRSLIGVMHYTLIYYVQIINIIVNSAAP